MNFSVAQIDEIKSKIERVHLNGPPPEEAAESLLLKPFSQIKLQSVKWLIPGWLPQGHLTLLAGQAGMGKTTIGLKIAALVSTGGKWPDGSQIRQGEVLIFAGEDDLGSTIKPNLMANHADTDKVHNLDGVKTKDGEVAFDPATHMPAVTAALKARPETRLVIIDPALAVAAKARDEYRATDIRKALAPVQEMARETGVACLMISHFLKRHNSTGSNPLDRVIGSQAWGAVARVVLAVDRTDSDDRALMRAKSNLSTTRGGWQYSITETRLNDRDPHTGLQLAFTGAVDGEAEAVFASASEGDRSSPARDAAVNWLRQCFAENPQPAKWSDICREAKQAGDIAQKTLRNARDILGAKGEIESVKIGKAWFWQTPNPATPRAN